MRASVLVQLNMMVIIMAKRTGCDLSFGDSRIIETKYGKLMGFVKTMPKPFSSSVEIYLGVPYATPPVLDLRFVPPVTPPPWDGLNIVDYYKPVCMQNIPDISNETEALRLMPQETYLRLKRIKKQLSNQSEDCLYLNIFVPLRGNLDVVEEPLPIVVFIHGDSFEYGSGNLYEGSALASYARIIVVTINYRLGRLGFLNANRRPHARVVSNVGLMDQIAVLHWIQENIGAFGGDARNVTLLGHGTGAACVHFLMLSPAVPEGLFSRAILMSGSAYSFWSTVSDPLQYASELSQALNCSSDGTPDVDVGCLRGVSARELMKPRIAGPKFLPAFAPSVDGVVVERDHRERWKRRPPPMRGSPDSTEAGEEDKQQQRPRLYDVLLGISELDAYPLFGRDDLRFGFDERKRDRVFRTLVRNAYRRHLREIFAAVSNEYTEWESSTQHPIGTRDTALLALSDCLYASPAVVTATFYSRNPPPERKVFLYVLSRGPGDGERDQGQGTVHGDDLPYLFGDHLSAEDSDPERSRKRTLLSEVMMTYWTNFAKTGDPTAAAIATGGSGKAPPQLGEWPPYEQGTQKYLELGASPTVRSHYRAHKLSLWLKLIPDIHDSGNDLLPLSHHALDSVGDEDLYYGPVRRIPEENATHGQPPPLQQQEPEAAVGAEEEEACEESGASGRPPPTAAAKRTEEVIGAVKTRPQPPLPHVPTALPPWAHPARGDPDGSDPFPDVASYVAQNSTALVATIAIGCSLLFLNLLIFVGVFYQRDRIRLLSKSVSRATEAAARCSRDGPGGGEDGEGDDGRTLLGLAFPAPATPSMKMNPLTDIPTGPCAPPNGSISVHLPASCRPAQQQHHRPRKEFTATFEATPTLGLASSPYYREMTV